MTVVTYYPVFEDDSALATAIRIGTTLILCIMMVTMIITVDAFTMITLIMYKYKFITLKQYFENLREDFFKLLDAGHTEMATERLANGLVEGIEMHKTLLKYVTIEFSLLF